MKQEKTYHIGEVSVENIAQSFGTPIYVYDTEQILSQMSSLKEAFKNINCKFKYAVKALSNINILKLIKKYGFGADTVSIEEVQLALEAGYSPSEIVYTPSNVSFEEVKKAIAKEVTLTVDSLSLLEKIGNYYSDIPIFIRWNPDLIAGEHEKVQVAHKSSKFGIDLKHKDEVLRIVNKYKIHVQGLHIHTGSGIEKVMSFIEGADKLMNLALEFKDLKFLSLGGGFKVAYTKAENDLDIRELAKQLAELLKRKYSSDSRKIPQIFFEPGKFLVSKAGYLLVRVNTVKESGNKQLACVNSGLNHLIRPAMYKAYHQVYNISNTDQGAKKKYDVVGYICETDTLAKDRNLADVKEGDILCFCNTGAYSLSMASNYNMRPLPAEVWIYKGQPQLIRKAQTYEQIMQNQILLNF